MGAGAWRAQAGLLSRGDYRAAIQIRPRLGRVVEALEDRDADATRRLQSDGADLPGRDPSVAGLRSRSRPVRSKR